MLVSYGYYVFLFLVSTTIATITGNNNGIVFMSGIVFCDVLREWGFGIATKKKED